MDEINYTDPALKEAAFALAEATPRHLDQPTTPPIHWREDNGLLRVLLADGRTVRGPLPGKKGNVKSKTNAQLAIDKALEVKPPARHKAGK